MNLKYSQKIEQKIKLVNKVIKNAQTHMYIGKYKLKSQWTIACHAHQLRKNKT